MIVLVLFWTLIMVLDGLSLTWSQYLTLQICVWLLQGADIQTHLPTSTKVWRDRSPASTVHTPGIMIWWKNTTEIMFWWRKHYRNHDLVEKIIQGSRSSGENTTGIMIWWKKYYRDHDLVEKIIQGSWSCGQKYYRKPDLVEKIIQGSQYVGEDNTGILINWKR